MEVWKFAFQTMNEWKHRLGETYSVLKKSIWKCIIDIDSNVKHRLMIEVFIIEQIILIPKRG